MRSTEYPYDLIIAVYPTYRALFDDWVLFNYTDGGISSFRWKKRFDKFETSKRIVSYASFEECIQESDIINKNIATQIKLSTESDELKESLLLKADKAIKARARLLKEEKLMLAAALKTVESAPRPAKEEIEIPSYYLQKNHVDLLDELMGELNKNPLIEIAHLKGNRRVLGRSLTHTDKIAWSDSYRYNERTAKIAYREIIARAFGLSGADHWGKTKSEIRIMLLPRANQLLQLASIKRMLSDAKNKGQKVLMAGSYVFWYEEEGGIGWTVKASHSSEQSKSGEALWHQGTIISKNHGRIVVFPYIKENGEHVKGHTKNAPHDGRAKPRHPDDYVELPFEVIDEDLMIGLFGELNYE